MTATSVDPIHTQAWLAATSTPPAVECPSWCSVPRQDHLAELEAYEGRAIHWSEAHSFGDEKSGGRLEVRLGRTLLVDGGRDNQDPDPLMHLDGNAVTIAAAEAYALRILDLVKAARS